MAYTVEIRQDNLIDALEEYLQRYSRKHKEDND